MDGTMHDDIHAWLASHAAAWNANDVAGLFHGAHQGLHWINVVGMHWQGLEAARHAHEVFFRVMFNNVSLTLEGVESIVAVGSDMRICVARWALGDYSTPIGDRIIGERNRMTLVFSGTGTELQLCHVANIRIDANAAAHDPAARAVS